VKSIRTRRFRALLSKLPPDVKRQAYTAYRLFKHDPNHPGLHFKRLTLNSRFTQFALEGIIVR